MDKVYGGVIGWDLEGDMKIGNIGIDLLIWFIM